MTKPKTLISRILYNKQFLQLILATFMIGIAIFFIGHEHLEVIKIRQQLTQCDPWWVLSGIALTAVYLLFQGLMYVHSFKAIGKKISFKSAVRLYLKRNLVSIFLPAGGFSSLLFFTKEVENEGASKSQIHLASTLFGFVSMMSVVVVAIPILGFAMFNHNVGYTEMMGFAGLILLIAVLIMLFKSLLQKGKAYRLLTRIAPSWALILDEMSAVKIHRMEIFKVLTFSTFIEIIGILHLYIAMLAIGVEPSILAAMIGYITMVILLMASPFLRGLGAIEVSVTFILGQFGFPIVLASAITLLYRFFEFWLPLLLGLLCFITKKDNLILRIFPACLIFLLGLVNIISAITPELPERLLEVRGLLPDYLITASNGFVLVIGLFLIILCVFLLQGSRRAWYFGLFLTLLSALGHLLKGADYEEAIFAFITAASLFYTGNFYKLKSHPKFIRISNIVLIDCVFALFVLGVMAFTYMNKRHFGVDFDLWTSVKTTFRLLFLFDSGDLVPLTVFARNFLHAIYISSGLVLCFIFFNILKPYVTKPFNSPEDKDLAKQLLKKYGHSSLDYFKTYPDKFFFFSEDRDGFISFKVTRNFAFVLENPVCKDEQASIELIKAFDLYCLENGFVSVFYRMPEQTLDIYLNLGKKILPIGDEAIVDLTVFPLDETTVQATRNVVKRLQSEGFTARTYTSPVSENLLQKLEHVSNSWLKDLNQREFAFAEGVFNRKILKDQTIITIEDKDEKVYAFLNVIPDYSLGEATYDLIRKSSDAPKGALDMLLFNTLLYFKEQGFLSANLGMAPLSSAEGAGITQKALKYAYENLKTFSHFKHLRRIKGKYATRWEAKYLIYSQSYHLPQIPRALKRVSEGR
jgi:phosphatidylglycerol lysyltransferase